MWGSSVVPPFCVDSCVSAVELFHSVTLQALSTAADGKALGAVKIVSNPNKGNSRTGDIGGGGAGERKEIQASTVCI